jgi:hypothetical protein
MRLVTSKPAVFATAQRSGVAAPALAGRAAVAQGNNANAGGPG